MNNFNDINPSRRSFLKRASSLTCAGMVAPWALNLGAMAQASAAQASDYKALVCVYLPGGNDYANTIVTYDSSSHAVYAAARPAFAYSREQLAATALIPTSDPVDSAGLVHQYALAPNLSPLLPLFNTGKLGIILNLGPLVEPTTKAQFTNNSVRLPSMLFSHNDQQWHWESAGAEAPPSGWGGRLGDLFQGANGQSAFSSINLADNCLFGSGRATAQYRMSPGGVMPLNALSSPLFGSGAASTAVRTLITRSRSHLLEEEYNRVTRRAIDAGEVIGATLSHAAPLATVFPAGNTLGDQLNMAARLMAVAPGLGIKRQVFYVTAMGGFDSHSGMRDYHPVLMHDLATALAAFYAATIELGIADQVTAFTASEFGRAMTGNGDGSDHGWGSMHWVMGGAVNGKRYYGTAPIVADNGPDDVGGRLLPTTSVDQLAATLGSWLGVSDSDLLAMLPNLANFNPSARKLGFV
jgi:uncharacterized protein (DUF1501 family)